MGRNKYTEAKELVGIYFMKRICKDMLSKGSSWNGYSLFFLYPFI